MKMMKNMKKKSKLRERNLWISFSKKSRRKFKSLLIGYKLMAKSLMASNQDYTHLLTKNRKGLHIFKELNQFLGIMIYFHSQ